MAPSRPEPVQEGDVGIHAYASQCDGIGGELKRVPADFIVTELLQDGQQVSLEPEGAAAAEEEADEEEAEDEWDEDGECTQLVRFVLRKEKQDTLGAVADLAEALGVPERAFSYAGLKDFHAVTVQEVVVQGVPPSRLRALQLARLQLGRIRLVERKLRLGECGGNRFRIRLRRLTRGREAVDAAIGALRERGFLNYFGLQRFGSHASRNDEVGRALLLGEYVQAVDSLLTNTRDGLKLPPAEREAREAWRRGDATAALRHMPRARVMERTLLKRLSLDMSKPVRPTHEECCRRAMLAVPLAQRLLLVHAFFSKAWNRMASERVRRYGCGAARCGELVIPPEGWEPAGGWPAEEACEGAAEGWEGWEEGADGAEATAEAEGEAEATGGVSAGREGWRQRQAGGVAAETGAWGEEGWGCEDGEEGEGKDWWEGASESTGEGEGAGAGAGAGTGAEADAEADAEAGAEAGAGAGLRWGGRARRYCVHVVSAAEAEAQTFDGGLVVLPLPGDRVRYPVRPERPTPRRPDTPTRLTLTLTSPLAPRLSASASPSPSFSPSSSPLPPPREPRPSRLARILFLVPRPRQTEQIGALYRQLLAHEGIDPNWVGIEVSACKSAQAWARR